MLLSELKERERRFKLALRAGIPILLLVSLVFYALFVQEDTFEPTPINAFLIAGIIFITVYFNYFLIEMSVKETVLDGTTHSFNEKSFIGKLQNYKPKTLILLRVNNLYSINENYSTKKVDLLLYTIVHKLDALLTQYGLANQLIGRRYGAEFIIALNKNDYDVRYIFEQFIQEHKLLTDIEVDYSFSAVTHTQDDIEQVLRRLKDLLGSSQDKGKKTNNIQDAKEVSQTEKDIIEALNHKRFKLGFRPIQSAKTQKIEIYEIASKLITKDQKEILPRVYLPVINRLDLAINYDLALVEHIIKLLPLIDEQVSFSFNISPFSLRNKGFQEKIFSLLDTDNIKTSRLIIQLYERKAHHDLSGYFKTLTIFRAKGLRICIDNFGSSSASMEYMKHFKFDMVKFDRDYVTNLQNPTNLTMLSSLISMSKTLDILTISKWVDTEEQKSTLLQLGINYLQGYGIDEPICEQQLIERYN